jgi:hypothetical protein
VTTGRRRFQIPFFPGKPLAETIGDESPKRDDEYFVIRHELVTIRHDIVTIRHDLVTIRHDIVGFCKIYRDSSRLVTTVAHHEARR